MDVNFDGIKVMIIDDSRPFAVLQKPCLKKPVVKW